jgi:hypothetical protein
MRAPLSCRYSSGLLCSSSTNYGASKKSGREFRVERGGVLVTVPSDLLYTLLGCSQRFRRGRGILGSDYTNIGSEEGNESCGEKKATLE